MRFLEIVSHKFEAVSLRGLCNRAKVASLIFSEINILFLKYIKIIYFLFFKIYL
jgi:hypothetical protein